MGFCWLCTGRINALQLQGQRIVSASTDHTVKVWNAKTRQYAHRLLFPLACVLVSWCADVMSPPPHATHTRFLFDLKGHTSAVNDVHFDEKKVVSADEDGSIRLWNFAETMPF